MNLLKNVIINGEIGFMYATVSFQYTFLNSGNTESPGFFMPVPENACITGFNFLDKERRIIRGDICEKADTEAENVVRLCTDDGGIYCFSWDEDDQREEYVFSVDMVIRLMTSGENTRMHIPLGIHTPRVSPAEYNTCPFELTLYAREISATATSVTHSVETVKFKNETMFRVNGSLGKDLVLDFNISERTSRGVLGEYMGRGIGVYRIFSQDRKRYVKEKENIILLLDLTGNIWERKRNALKELLFRMVQKISESYPLQILTTDEENAQLFNDFTRCDGEMYDEIFEKLSNVSYMENNFENMLRTAEEIKSDKTEIILISGGDFSDINSVIAKSNIKKINLFTVGDFGETNFAKGWKRRFCGVHEHFYSADITESHISRAVRRVVESGDSVEITADNSAVDELMVLQGTDIAADGYIDAVVTYTGVRPRDFSIVQNGKPVEVCTVPDRMLYQTLPEAEQIFAMEKTERLYRLLQHTAPVSVKAIKKQLEIAGIKGGILNSETAVVIRGEKKKSGITVEMYSESNPGINEFAHRPSVFGQSDFTLRLKENDRKYIIERCKEILLRNVRCDGAVTDSLCAAERVKDSVYGLAAIMLINETELAPVAEDIKEYIKDKDIRGFEDVLYNNLNELELFLKINRDAVFKDFSDFNELIAKSDVKSAARTIMWIFI